MSVAALGSCTPEDISLISRRPVTRRRRVMASLVLAGGLAGIIGVVTGGTAAWAVMAVAVALGLAYTGALVHMRRLAEAREISRAFGRHPGWESFAREPAIFPDDQPDRVAAV
ncbi:MAG: hypothetical protein J2P57_14265, partial [Acidimicrobiaceae bacterium]|nr:hypothetical protein [Acidimicrobiaceae bacterium]